MDTKEYVKYFQVLCSNVKTRLTHYVLSHWQRFLLRYILRRCRDTLAATRGASWNGPGGGVVPAVVTRRRCPDEDPTSALCAPLPMDFLKNPIAAWAVG